MARVRLVVSSLALIALLATAPAPGAAQQVTGFCFGEVCVPPDAVAYLADFCWTFPAADEEARLVLGVTHMGAKRFSLNGTVGTAEKQFPVTGMATRRGAEWLITMTATGGNVGLLVSIDTDAMVDVAGARLFYATLDGATLAGQLLAVDVRSASAEADGFASGVRHARAVELTPASCE